MPTMPISFSAIDEGPDSPWCIVVGHGRGLLILHAFVPLLGLAAVLVMLFVVLVTI